MTDLATVLELLYDARHRYRTVRGALETWHDPRRLMEAHRRNAERRRGLGFGGSMQIAIATSGEGQAELPNEQREVMRFWYEPPDRLREEARTFGAQEHERVLVKDGTRWWTYSPDWGAMSNVGLSDQQAASAHAGGGEQLRQLLDPTAFLVGLEIGEVESGADWLGRPTLRARGGQRVSQETVHFPGLFMLDSADACELLVDRECGVVLKVAFFLDNDEFAGSSFTEIVFDEHFRGDVFVFEAPPGEDVRTIEVGRSHRYTLGEAASAASFTVFKLRDLPEGDWRLHVHYSEKRERPPMPEIVHLAYHRADATEHISVSQRPVGEGGFGWSDYRPDGPELEEIARSGRTYVVSARNPEYDVPATVAFDQEGTAIQLTSTEVDVEALLQLAEGLEPAASA